MHEAAKAGVITRLKRIEGQVGGLIRMVDEDRYCVDVLTQINAVRAAFKAGIKPSQIARQFGISQSDVRKVLMTDTTAKRGA